QEVDHVLRPSVQLGVTLLPTEALHLRDRDALNPDSVQSFLHLVELEGFDDRLDFLHRTFDLSAAARRATFIPRKTALGGSGNPAISTFRASLHRAWSAVPKPCAEAPRGPLVEDLDRSVEDVRDLDQPLVVVVREVASPARREEVIAVAVGR